jgi:hypothetical protein
LCSVLFCSKDYHCAHGSNICCFYLNFEINQSKNIKVGLRVVDCEHDFSALRNGPVVGFQDHVDPSGSVMYSNSEQLIENHVLSRILSLYYTLKMAQCSVS